MSTIDHFDTHWLCLSNFAAAPTEYMGRLYPTSEHAYQAAKVLNPVNKGLVAFASTPGKAKLLGRLQKDRDDWNDVKINIMKEIVWAKFSQNDDLPEVLMSTGDSFLQEGNHWGDKYWGVCKMNGQNQLGHILMDARDELRRVHGGATPFVTVVPELFNGISDLPLEQLKVFEKIGEEFGEFQDEVIKGTSFLDLAEESVDLLVTSVAALEIFNRQNKNSELQCANKWTWRAPRRETSTIINNPFDIAQSLAPDFLSAYGQLAKKQRKWRALASEENTNAYLSSIVRLIQIAYVISSSLQAHDSVMNTYNRKIVKWRGYALDPKKNYNG